MRRISPVQVPKYYFQAPRIGQAEGVIKRNSRKNNQDWIFTPALILPFLLL